MVDFLKNDRLLADGDWWAPEVCSRAVLRKGCSASHLFLLNYSLYICKMIELPLCFLPAFLLRLVVLNPMLLMTQGTVDGAIMAFTRGAAFNIGGGFHHSSRSKSGGFCIFPDISLAIYHLRDYFGLSRFMIIDLDAHQGDGHERDFMDDPNVHIVDFYNPDVFPGDHYARKAIKTGFHVRYETKDAQYLEQVHRKIGQAVEVFQPEFIVYNAGTDISSGDPLGHLNISDQAIIERDEAVFEIALGKKIPILMILSGGYQKKNAKTIAESISNLHRRFNVLNMQKAVDTSKKQ